jgi:hypothetical protein
MHSLWFAILFTAPVRGGHVHQRGGLSGWFDQVSTLFYAARRLTKPFFQPVSTTQLLQ